MAYFDRHIDGTEVLCDDCGEVRWGKDDGESNDAFNARYNDKSGDWCWTPLWSMEETPCTDCGNPVDEPRVRV